MRALAASAIAALIALPAHAQKLPPLNLLRDNSPDAYTVQRQREIERDYNEAIKKIPDRKKTISDPWKNTRAPDVDKPKSR